MVTPRDAARSAAGDVAEAAGLIESVARRDPGQRGLASLADAGRLLPAATELIRAERAIIVTGFCVRSAMIGETDGPPGALALARALSALGAAVRLVTDGHSAALLEAGSAALGASFPTTVLRLPQEAADREMLGLLSSFSPTHVVAIERPGSARDGHRYSMRGEILDDLAPAAEILLDPPFPRRFKTVAIGDGGNELGMGGLRDSCAGGVTHGELIFSAAAADHAIAAGISNWGAYALAAVLSLLAGKSLIAAPDRERAALEAVLAAGAVDGCTKRRELSVDGLPWAEYSSALSEIHDATLAALGKAGTAGGRGGRP